MGIPGYGSPYIAYQQPFGSYSPQRGVPSYGLANPTGFPPAQFQGDMFSPTASALDFSNPMNFTGMPISNTAAFNPFMTSFSPQLTGLTTSRGLDEVDVFGIGDGTKTTGTMTSGSTTETTGAETAENGGEGTVDVFGNGTTTDDGDTANTETKDDEETEGKDGKKKHKMTMGEYLNYILYCRRPNGTIDWAAFAAKCQTEEKPVKVTPLEAQVFGNYDEG